MQINDILNVSVYLTYGYLANWSLKVVGKAIVDDNAQKIVNGTFSPIKSEFMEEIPTYENSTLIFCDWSKTVGQMVKYYGQLNILFFPRAPQMIITLKDSIWPSCRFNETNSIGSWSRPDLFLFATNVAH